MCASCCDKCYWCAFSGFVALASMINSGKVVYIMLHMDMRAMRLLYPHYLQVKMQFQIQIQVQPMLYNLSLL